MTDTEKSRAREWWIEMNASKFFAHEIFNNVVSPPDGWIEVIEKPAYDKLLVERDEVIRRYQSIELANSEMSRNDHVHFGDLIQERDELKKHLELTNEGWTHEFKMKEKLDEARAEVTLLRQQEFESRKCSVDEHRENLSLKAEVEKLRFELQAAVTTNEGFHQEIERLDAENEKYHQLHLAAFELDKEQSALLDLAVGALKKYENITWKVKNGIGDFAAKDALEKIKKARGE